jgi:octaprenyl-diphosphate synthase
MIEGASYQESILAARLLVQEDLERVGREMDRLAERLHHAEMSERLQTVLARKGKQVRSTLLLLLARTGPTIPDPDRLARTAASIELVHTASLLHDDVIDETEMRRGQLTAHERWGNKLAVLTGDYVLSCALSLVITDDDRRIAKMVSESSSRLVAGEVAQMDFQGRNLGLDDYERVIDGKTASLLETAAACGAILAGHDAQTVAKCAELGRHFGYTFQIVDDLLDYGFGAKDLDKATLTDLKGGLMTLPMIYYYLQASETERSELEDLRQHADQKSAREELLRRRASSGAFESTRQRAQNHVDSSLAILQAFPDSAARNLLSTLCQGILFRGN